MLSKELSNIKKEGFAFIYVIIIIVPVAIMITGLLEIAVTDYKVSNNILYGQQAYYNAEIGINYEIVRLNNSNLQKNEDYYIYFNNEEIVFSRTKMDYKSFAEVNVRFTTDSDKGKYIISSKGNYYGYINEIKKTVDNNF